MDYTEIVKKLIGYIDPVGETNIDDKRFENLKAMCELVNNLVTEIDEVSFYNKNKDEYSRKRAGEYDNNFLANTLGIES